MDFACWPRQTVRRRWVERIGSVEQDEARRRFVRRRLRNGDDLPRLLDQVLLPAGRDRDDVGMLSGLDAPAGVALAAAHTRHLGTMERERQGQRRRPLAHAFGSVEKAGMGQPPRGHGPGQHRHRVLLSN